LDLPRAPLRGEREEGKAVPWESIGTAFSLLLFSPSSKGNTGLATWSVEEIDADAAEGLPEADVKLELQARLISMEKMGQLDQDRSVLGDFGAAVVSR
jgi:hypothetical protein